jgi:hypothetical protein
MRVFKAFFYTLACLLCVLASSVWISRAFATPMYGLLCFSEQAADEVALANQTGGFDLEELVANSLVEQNKCLRLKRSEALQGHIVYEGKTFGQKQVVGVSPNEEGKPQLFGLVSIALHGRSA